MRLIALTAGLVVAGAALVAPSHVAATPIKMVPASATASNTYAGTSPNNVTDGLPGTIWSAGAFPSQWIQLDFGRSFALRKIRLQVEQAPAGTTRHRILVGSSPSSLREVTAFSGNTVDGQWLEFTAGDRNTGTVRYVRVLTDQSPSWVGWKEIEVYQGVEYFGFFRDAMPDHGMGDYIDETTSAGANLVWVGWTAPEIATRLQHAQARGAKAMVDLQDQLFTDTYQLRSDFETRWRAIADQVRLFPGVVACFYLIDEPYLHYDRDATRSALATAAARVRQDFPQVPIAVILSKSEVDTINSGYISMFDWVGFDRYRAFAELPPIIQRLEAMLSPSQREIAVPWAFRRVSEGLGVPEQDEVVQNINGWHNEILANPRYIAVVPFLWETIDDMVGARELPMIGERTKQLASYTLSRTTRVPHDVMHTVLEMFKF